MLLNLFMFNIYLYVSESRPECTVDSKRDHLYQVCNSLTH